MTPEQREALRAVIQQINLEEGYGLSLHIEALKEQVVKQSKVIKLLAVRLAAMEQREEKWSQMNAIAEEAV